MEVASRLYSRISSKRAHTFYLKETSLKCLPQKLKIILLPAKLWIMLGKKGGAEGYQDVNNSLAGCSLVHSQTNEDSHADTHQWLVMINTEGYYTCLFFFFTVNLHIIFNAWQKKPCWTFGSLFFPGAMWFFINAAKC